MRIVNWSMGLGLAGVFGLLGAGCVVREVRERREPVYVERRPVVVERGPVVVQQQPVYVEPPPPPAQPVIVEQAPPVEEQVLVVRREPPPLRVEVRPRAPSPGHVWIEGNWVVHHGQWVWVRGRWDLPPRPGVHWEPHRWEHVGAEFHLRIGGWR